MYQSNDYTHANKVRSIYDRTDYLINVDLSIPFALVGGLRQAIIFEGMIRTGVPQNDPRPYHNPLVLARNKLPKPIMR